MAMHSSLFGKENNTTSVFSAVTWWSGLGSQPEGFHDDHFGPQLKSASSVAENLSNNTSKEPAAEISKVEQEIPKGNNTNHFTIFPDECKSPPNGQKFQLQNASNIQVPAVEYRGHFELGFSQPVICAKYPYGEQCYGVFSTFGPQLTGRIMLPLNSTSDEAPIFVNVKQYNGILRRRLYRAKAALENKGLKNRKPFLHLSRHLHAKRRPRGCGGRFLNTKDFNGSKGSTDDKGIAKGQLSQPTESQSSVVLQSDCRNSSSPKESNGYRSNNLGSEVISLFSRVDLDPFPFNNLSPNIQSLPNMMNTGHGIVLPSKWVAAADSRCNLKV
ncbi:hypothetical protein ACH5RR_004479 [Cinchona calisaya]|uniref:Nuclear transcription factor Y subunit n=1 Tax=Cinchona calisaya TaxID=153742 RepID=A0ABD3AXQ7_9GENT